MTCIDCPNKEIGKGDMEKEITKKEKRKKEKGMRKQMKK